MYILNFTIQWGCFTKSHIADVDLVLGKLLLISLCNDSNSGNNPILEVLEAQ